MCVCVMCVNVCVCVCVCVSRPYVGSCAVIYCTGDSRCCWVFLHLRLPFTSNKPEVHQLPGRAYKFNSHINVGRTSEKMSIVFETPIPIGLFVNHRYLLSGGQTGGVAAPGGMGEAVPRLLCMLHALTMPTDCFTIKKVSFSLTIRLRLQSH